MKKLENKVAIVTGASTGIGEAIAKLFASEGAKLALAARSLDKLETLARSLGPDVLPLRTDMTDPTQIREMVRLTVERFGRLDILINNAGVGLYGTFAEMPPEHLQHLVATNWLGPAYAIQAAIPYLRKQRRGQIINISSVAGKVAIPWMTAYSSTKFALNALSYGLRMELEEDNIQVISVCPGRIKTPFNANAFKDASTSPLPPGGISPERVARAILRASLRGTREIIVPAGNWSFVWFHFPIPGIVDWMMVRYLRRGMRKPDNS
jgi:short-subunit dehydrogenase